MKNFVQPGLVMTVTAAAVVAGGSPVVVGSVIGVAAHDANVGDELELNLEGVYTLPKSGGAIAQGAALTFDVSAGSFIVGAGEAGDVKGVAFAFGAAPTGVGTVQVRLSAAAGTVVA